MPPIWDAKDWFVVFKRLAAELHVDPLGLTLQQLTGYVRVIRKIDFDRDMASGDPEIMALALAENPDCVDEKMEAQNENVIRTLFGNGLK